MQRVTEDERPFVNRRFALYHGLKFEGVIVDLLNSQLQCLDKQIAPSLERDLRER
ncbi:hypothetical protein ACF1AJ_10855 [Leifsonia sp. NPDC014704]|uniref:hypothetical protein n=1 Tax=Leifsonia sp. NPDC014704 TaxID=3364123 RepID=UPI0036F49EB6